MGGVSPTTDEGTAAMGLATLVTPAVMSGQDDRYAQADEHGGDGSVHDSGNLPAEAAEGTVGSNRTERARPTHPRFE